MCAIANAWLALAVACAAIIGASLWRVRRITQRIDAYIACAST